MGKSAKPLPYRFNKHLQGSAPHGVDFVTRLITSFDTHRLQFEAVSAGGGPTSTVRVHEPARRPIEITAEIGMWAPQKMPMALATIANEGKGWHCSDAATMEMIQAPAAQLTLDATSAIFRAREPERAKEFAAAHLPGLHIKDHQIRNQDTKEWFTRLYTLQLETYDEAVVAHSAWGLFDWLRKTKQVPGRRGTTGASQFVEQQLGRFRAERELAALRYWNEL